MFWFKKKLDCEIKVTTVYNNEGDEKIGVDFKFNIKQILNKYPNKKIVEIFNEYKKNIESDIKVDVIIDRLNELCSHSKCDFKYDDSWIIDCKFYMILPSDVDVIKNTIIDGLVKSFIKYNERYGKLVAYKKKFDTK